MSLRSLFPRYALMVVAPPGLRCSRPPFPFVRAASPLPTLDRLSALFGSRFLTIHLCAKQSAVASYSLVVSSASFFPQLMPFAYLKGYLGPSRRSAIVYRLLDLRPRFGAAKHDEL